MKKYLIPFVLLFVFGVQYALGATPACGATISNSVVFDSDISCGGDGFDLENQNDIVVDCAGYQYTYTADDRAWKYGRSDNITIKNCDMVFTDGGNSWYFDGDHTGNLTVTNNNITLVGDIDQMGVIFFIEQPAGWYEITNNHFYLNTTTGNYVNLSESFSPLSSLFFVYDAKISDNLHIANNTAEGNILTIMKVLASSDSPYGKINMTDNIFETNLIPNSSLGYTKIPIFFIQPDLVIMGYENRFFNDANVYNNNFIGFTDLAERQNDLSLPYDLTTLSPISDNQGYGNYYDWFSCTDTTPDDGICDSTYTEINLTDNYPLASPAPFVGEEENCTPDWSCTGYSACNESNVMLCDTVTDLNTCGEAYSGDYSEFGEFACDYCQYDVELVNETECIDSTQTECWLDNNWAACCAVTGFASDCYLTSLDPETYNWTSDTICWTADCSMFGYTEGDIASSIMDGIVRFVISLGIFIVPALLIFGGAYLYQVIRGKPLP